MSSEFCTDFLFFFALESDVCRSSNHDKTYSFSVYSDTYTFVKRNAKIILTEEDDHIFFPSASFEIYAAVCPASYVDYIGLCPVIGRFLCCAVP